MEKSNIFGSDNQRDVNPEWFTGRVWMKALQSNRNSDMYHVHFEKGSRTNLHKHDGPQELIVTEGQGSLEIYDSEDFKSDGEPFTVTRTKTVPLSVGDVVHIPADTLHTHGSTNTGKTFSHIAINNLPCGVGEFVTAWYRTDGQSVTGRI